MRSILNEGVNITVNTIESGKAIDIVATSSTTTTANVSMLTNTSEQTLLNDNDWCLVADNATGKVIKRVQISNLVKSAYWTFATPNLYPDNTADNLLVGTTSNSSSKKLNVVGDCEFSNDLKLVSLNSDGTYLKIAGTQAQTSYGEKLNVNGIIHSHSKVVVDKSPTDGNEGGELLLVGATNASGAEDPTMYRIDAFEDGSLGGLLRILDDVHTRLRLITTDKSEQTGHSWDFMGGKIISAVIELVSLTLLANTGSLGGVLSLNRGTDNITNSNTFEVVNDNFTSYSGGSGTGLVIRSKASSDINKVFCGHDSGYGQSVIINPDGNNNFVFNNLQMTMRRNDGGDGNFFISVGTASSTLSITGGSSLTCNQDIMRIASNLTIRKSGTDAMICNTNVSEVDGQEAIRINGDGEDIFFNLQSGSTDSHKFSFRDSGAETSFITALGNSSFDNLSLGTYNTFNADDTLKIQQVGLSQLCIESTGSGTGHNPKIKFERNSVNGMNFLLDDNSKGVCELADSLSVKVSGTTKFAVFSNSVSITDDLNLTNTDIALTGDLTATDCDITLDGDIIFTPSTDCDIKLGTQVLSFSSSNGFFIDADTKNTVLHNTNGECSFQSDRNLVIYNNSGVALFASNTGTSERRFKENIATLDCNNCCEIVKALNPVSFNFIESCCSSKCKRLGFIVDEIEDKVPSCIKELTSKNNEKTKILYKEELVPLLVSTLQMVMKKMETMEEEIESMKVLLETNNII